jgi:hypothetical protein
MNFSFYKLFKVTVVLMLASRLDSYRMAKVLANAQIRMHFKIPIGAIYRVCNTNSNGHLAPSNRNGKALAILVVVAFCRVQTTKWQYSSP